ncbi:hypothetical protein FE633_10725 [Streptomyces montanus]|uniref:Uncharacterized protein n=1 Tax=Streptomyces montanus TaxID=2580423 RepID=A0A5R9FQ27_9ACTN|nr:hypothetical protein [Streptomyces montanus]TLS46022.1 hypothetical protein FE633_10725 [Streptomyces montanus]
MQVLTWALILLGMLLCAVPPAVISDPRIPIFRLRKGRLAGALAAGCVLLSVTIGWYALVSVMLTPVAVLLQVAADRGRARTTSASTPTAWVMKAPTYRDPATRTLLITRADHAANSKPHGRVVGRGIQVADADPSEGRERISNSVGNELGAEPNLRRSTSSVGAPNRGGDQHS